MKADRILGIQESVPLADKILNELAWVPLPFLSPLEWSVAKALVNNPELQSNIPEKTLPIDSIKPTQWRLDKETVEEYAKNGNTSGGLGFTRGTSQVYLWDGHHRYFANKKNGAESHKLRVMDLADKNTLGSQDGMSMEELCAQLKQQSSDILAAMDSHDRTYHE